MHRPRRILGRAGLARCRRQAGVIEGLGGALLHGFAQALPHGGQGLRLEADPFALRDALHQVRSHQPASVGHGRVHPGHLQGGDQHRPLADRGGDRVHGGPGLAQHALLPGLIAQQAGTLLLLQLQPGGAAEAQLAGRLEQRIGPHLQASPVEEAVAAQRQGHGETDRPHAHVVAVAESRVAEAGGGELFGIGGVLSRFQGGDAGDDLEGAGGRKALQGTVEQRSIRGIQVPPLADAGGR